jgi:hypothetical protein
LLRNITLARIFWLGQSEEKKNSAQPRPINICVVGNVRVTELKSPALLTYFRIQPNGTSKCQIGNHQIGLRIKWTPVLKSSVSSNFSDREQNAAACKGEIGEYQISKNRIAPKNLNALKEDLLFKTLINQLKINKGFALRSVC